VASTEHAKGSREGRKALLQELGFEKFEDIQTLVATHKDAQLAAMTEAERMKAEAAEAVKAAKADRAAIAAERHSFSVERALMAAGAQGELARISKLVDVEVGADPEAIQAAVDALKADPTLKVLFGAATATPAPSEPSGGGPSSRPSPRPDALSRGDEKAKARNPEVRRSYL
jgi:hypothetical protein